MTIPALILGIVLSTVYGAVFHMWRGGGGWRLLLYLVLGWTGFWAGHILANSQGWNFIMVGPLQLGTATVGSIIFLFVGYWLSLVEVQPTK